LFFTVFDNFYKNEAFRLHVIVSHAIVVQGVSSK